MSVVAILLILAAAVAAHLVPSLRPLQPLFSSSPHVQLEFPGTQLTGVKANAILAIFILRAIVSRLARLIPFRPLSPSGTKQSVSTPFALSSNDIASFHALTSGKSGQTGPQDLATLCDSTYHLQLFLAALVSPSIILLLAKRGADVDALGAVNVRNTFHHPPSTLATALQKALDQPNALRVRSSIDTAQRRKVKRGWEFDILAELVKGDEVLFRMTFTALSMAKHQSQVGIVLRQRGTAEESFDQTGECRVTERDVDAWVGLSKDRNPIHTSHFAARLFGLRGRIAHGNLVVAKALGELASKSKRDGDLEVEFLRPVHIPAQLDVFEGPDGRRLELRSKGKALVGITFK